MTSIRAATIDDARELARLLTQLGHPTSESHVREIWDTWGAEQSGALVATGEGDSLAGVVTLHRMRVLHRPKPVGRISSLIVDEPFRGLGLGRALVEAAERQLLAIGCGLLEITSNNRRTDAHAFYERLGYEKTSVRLAKSLDRDERAERPPGAS